MDSALEKMCHQNPIILHYVAKTVSSFDVKVIYISAQIYLCLVCSVILIFPILPFLSSGRGWSRGGKAVPEVGEKAAQGVQVSHRSKRFRNLLCNILCTCFYTIIVF